MDMIEQLEHSQRSELKRKVGHTKGGKWPQRSGVESLRKSHLHNPEGVID